MMSSQCKVESDGDKSPVLNLDDRSPPISNMPTMPTMMPQMNMADFMMRLHHMQQQQIHSQDMMRRLQQFQQAQQQAQQPPKPRVERKTIPTLTPQTKPSTPVVHHNTPLAHQMAYAAGTNPDDPKPAHSYIGLIAMAILSTDEQKMVLSDIYQWIMDNYSYFHHRGPGWRNSIRHNLSLNDCFVKAGRSANGKGHYWAIHVANLEDFIKGDYRRRRAQRKVRRHMGLSVGEEDSDSDNDGPPTAGAQQAMPSQWMTPPFSNPIHAQMLIQAQQLAALQAQMQMNLPPKAHNSSKRAFSVANLLAKEDSVDCKKDCLSTSPKIDNVAQSLWLKSLYSSAAATATPKSTASSTSQWPVWPTSSGSTSSAGNGTMDLSPKSTESSSSQLIVSPVKEDVIDTAKQWKHTFDRIMARSTLGKKDVQP